MWLGTPDASLIIAVENYELWTRTNQPIGPYLGSLSVQAEARHFRTKSFT